MNDFRRDARLSAPFVWTDAKELLDEQRTQVNTGERGPKRAAVE